MLTIQIVQTNYSFWRLYITWAIKGRYVIFCEPEWLKGLPVADIIKNEIVALLPKISHLLHTWDVIRHAYFFNVSAPGLRPEIFRGIKNIP